MTDPKALFQHTHYFSQSMLYVESITKLDINQLKKYMFRFEFTDNKYVKRCYHSDTIDADKTRRPYIDDSHACK